MPPAVSKHGLYGVFIAQYANVKKTTATNAGASTLASKPHELSVIIERPENDAPSASAAPKPKQVRCGNYILYLNKKHKRFKTFGNLQLKLNIYPYLLCTVWKVEEHVDLLILYKNMLLSGIKKDNFKELSKRMDELGWERNNDQCRQQVVVLDIQSYMYVLHKLCINISQTHLALFIRYICCKIGTTK